MSQAPAPLPDKFAALADGPTNEGTPTAPAKSFMLTRHQTERLVGAARAVLQSHTLYHPGPMPASDDFLRPQFFVDAQAFADLRMALAGINIDV